MYAFLRVSLGQERSKTGKGKDAERYACGAAQPEPYRRGAPSRQRALSITVRPAHPIGHASLPGR
jgi:hypothetical protein